MPLGCGDLAMAMVLSALCGFLCGMFFGLDALDFLSTIGFALYISPVRGISVQASAFLGRGR